MSEWIELCDVSELNEKEIMPIDFEDTPLMIIKHNGEFHVTSRICTHQTFDLTKGIYNDGYITCILHGSIFEIDTGEVLNPPATEDLYVYNTKISDGKILIEI